MFNFFVLKLAELAYWLIFSPFSNILSQKNKMARKIWLRRSDFFYFFDFLNTIEVLINFSSFTDMKMNELKAAPSSTLTKMSPLLDRISQTCDALFAVLDMTSEQTSQYGGGILQSFDSEFVDVVVKLIVQLRLYTKDLQRQLAIGIIKNPNDLALYTQGIQDLIDQINLQLLKDGCLRNHFAFAFQEIQQELASAFQDIQIA